MKILKFFLLGALLMPQQLFGADKLVINYSRLDKVYSGWNLWVWNDEAKTPGFELAPAGDGPYGVYYELDLDASGLAGKRTGFLPRRGNWTDKDAPDRILAAARQGEVYLMEGDGAVYSAPPAVSTAITGAFLDEEGAVRVTFTRPLDAAFLAGQGFRLSRGAEILEPVSATPIGGAYSRAARLAFKNLKPDHKAVNAGEYKLEVRPADGAEPLSPGGSGPVTLQLGGAVYASELYSPLEMGLTAEDLAAKGVVGTTLINQAVMLLYRLGMSPQWLSRLYYR